jgi:hypothetical protein
VSVKREKALQQLSDDVLLFLHELDRLMKLPSTVGRGKQIAKCCNWLEMQNDRLRFGMLGVDYRKDDKEKAVTKLKLERSL